MKISGAATLHAPAGQVWTALSDPNVLVATIPGCERLEPAGPDSYRFTVGAAVASVQGIYTGEVSLSQREPSSFVLTASGAGGPGAISASVQVRLADTADGSTELSYDADAVISGLIAGVGQRVLSSVASRMAGQFLSSLDNVLADAGVASQATGPAGPGALPASTAPASTAPASTAPASTAPVLAPSSQPSATASPPAAAPSASGFVRGVLVGAAVTLAAMAVRGLIGRRAR